MSENEITEKIIGCAIRVHKELGPGLLESSYQAALQYELVDNGLKVQRELPFPMNYRDVKLDCGYRLDFLVEGQIIVEIKSVQCFTDVHIAQTITYLKLSKQRIGILLNFNVARMKDGIKRIIN